MMPDPIPPVSIRDLDGFDRPGFVAWERRQPAEYSWWIGLDRRQHAQESRRQLPRMRTSPFSRPILRVLE